MPQTKEHYDGTKLLSLKDIDGDEPEIYLCSTNRSGGKSTYFNRLCINRFLKHNEKFLLLYRYKYEISDADVKFFNGIKPLFFPDMNMTSKLHKEQGYAELFLNDKSCGYATSLSCSDLIKKYSHVYSDVCLGIFDEYQSETNDYLSDELVRFQSIHKSIARGGGKSVRRVPFILISNPVSILNPYFSAFGVVKHLRKGVEFVRGPGWVLETSIVESVKKAQHESGFGKAFANSQYEKYAADGQYLFDDSSFIGKPSGRSRYICTFKFDGINYAVREYMDQGIIYCDNCPDMSFPIRFSANTSDHDVNYVMSRYMMNTIETFRKYFAYGAFRFNDAQSKVALINLISFH